MSHLSGRVFVCAGTRKRSDFASDFLLPLTPAASPVINGSPPIDRQAAAAVVAVAVVAAAAVGPSWNLLSCEAAAAAATAAAARISRPESFPVAPEENCLGLEM